MAKRGNGEGSITVRKRDPKGRPTLYQGAAIVGYKESGEPIRKFIYGKKRAEVSNKLKEMTMSVKKGSYIEPTKDTLSIWMQRWLTNYKKNTLKPKTYESYQYLFETHIQPSIGHLRIVDIKTPQLQEFYNTLLTDNSRKDGKEGSLSVRTVRYIHSIISACLNQAKKEGFISNNPADNCHLPRLIRKKPKIMDINALLLYIEAAKKLKHFVALMVVLATGIRLGELLALRWQDVDLDQGVISIKRNLIRIKKTGLIFQDAPKTNYSFREIPLPMIIINLVKKHKLQQDEKKLLLGDGYIDHDLVFCNDNGLPYDPQTFAERHKTVLRKANLDYCKFHSLRHTYATIMTQLGVPRATIKENMGHYEEKFMDDSYVTVTLSEKQKAAKKIGRLFRSLE